jgi:hypothetical protein
MLKTGYRQHYGFIGPCVAGVVGGGWIAFCVGGRGLELAGT